MKYKSLIVGAVVALALSPMAMADNGKALLEKGINAYKKGDYAQAAQAFEQSCNDDVAPACALLSELYDEGRGVPQDKKMTAQLLEKACEGEFVGACFNLGVKYNKGEGVKKDRKRAAELYQRGCDRGDGASCHNLGTMYYDGQGVKKDKTQALMLYETACSSEHKQACYDVSVMYLKGIGVRKYANKEAIAARFSHKGCKLGHQGCCQLFEEIKKRSESPSFFR